MTAALRPHGLTHVQFVLLANAWWLNTTGEEPTQARVAERAGTDVKMTSEVLRAVEAKGLLRREPDPHDARARRLVVTPAGARLAQAAITAVEAVDEAAFGVLSEATRRHTLIALRTLAEGPKGD